MKEPFPTFSNLIRESEFKYTGVLWQFIYSLTTLAFIIVNYYKLTAYYDNFYLFLVIYLPLFHDIFVNRYLTQEGKGRSLKTFIIKLKLSRKRIAEEFSPVGLLFLFKYASFLGFLLSFVKGYLYLAFILLILSIICLVIILLFITKTVYLRVTDEYKRKFKYIKYKLSIFFSILIVEIILFYLIIFNLINTANISLILIGHFVGVFVQEIIEKFENQSIEVAKFEKYDLELQQREGGSIISTYFTNLPKILIQSKYNLDFTLAAVISLIPLTYIIAVALLNILDWSSMHWISILLWVVGGLMYVVLIILIFDNITKTRTSLNRQIQEFQKAMDNFEESNKKYIDILGE